LLPNDKRKASATSPKICRFSAQVITVRGDISVLRSPAAKPWRVRSAIATMRCARLRPASSASAGTRASTMATSSSAGRKFSVATMFQRSICAWFRRCAPWYRPFRLPRPTVLAVANKRNAGCGDSTRFWSISVNLPSRSSTRWITNITSGRPASYSSNTSATGRCSAQGTMPG
jgi:hypothetical protein